MSKKSSSNSIVKEFKSNKILILTSIIFFVGLCLTSLLGLNWGDFATSFAIFLFGTFLFAFLVIYSKKSFNARLSKILNILNFVMITSITIITFFSEDIFRLLFVYYLGIVILLLVVLFMVSKIRKNK